jgi:hypothetical protein
MTESIIKPLHPTGPGWKRAPNKIPSHYALSTWAHEQGFLVMSAVEVVTESGKTSNGPEYHISISKWVPPFDHPRRASSTDAVWILSQFADPARFEEDNHVPGGAARHFWSPVAEKLIGLECACKGDEPVVREDKGDFIWRGVTR